MKDPIGFDSPDGDSLPLGSSSLHPRLVATCLARPDLEALFGKCVNYFLFFFFFLLIDFIGCHRCEGASKS